MIFCTIRVCSRTAVVKRTSVCIHTRRFAETCINIFLNGNTNSTVAAVGTAWSLLGSHRNGQSALYLFQKHLLFSEHDHSFSHCGRFCNGCKMLSCLTNLPVHPLPNNRLLFLQAYLESHLSARFSLKNVNVLQNGGC